MLETDAGARRLGEVALVPHSSPIAASGLLFFNTLFDENAASHIALGQAYSKCIRNGDKLSEAELTARGTNRSLIHIDWMIGSAAIDVDGVRSDGGGAAHAQGDGRTDALRESLGWESEACHASRPYRLRCTVGASLAHPTPFRRDTLPAGLREPRAHSPATRTMPARR